MLLGLIFLVIIILIVVIIVVNPAILFGQRSGTQIDFRQFCLHWSLSDYREGPPTGGVDDNITVGVKQYPVKENCAQSLGIPDPDDLDINDFNNCRELCKARA